MSSPRELESWTKNSGSNATYSHLPGNVRGVVKARLLQEQGFLCAYSGERISSESSHIEHLKPQRVCQEEGRGEDLEYANLLACFPSERAKQKAPYGAHAKDAWHDPALFVHPLPPGCEQRFRFTLNGEISPAKGDDAAAKETIARLKLDNQGLAERRAGVIATALGLDDHPLSDSKVRELLTKIDERDAKGELYQFCFAVKQAGAEFLRRRERQRQKRLLQHNARPAE